MLNIPSSLKKYFNDDGHSGRYLSDSVTKYLFIRIDGKEYTNEDIYFEEFSLTESIIENSWAFVGCIANEMKVKLHITDDSIRESQFKGLPISASIAVEIGVDDDGVAQLSSEIPLFVGYVDNATKHSDKRYIELVSYDAMNKLASLNVWNWYRNAFKKGPLSIVALVASLFQYINENFTLDYEYAIELPLDHVKVKKRIKDKNMTALDLLKAICEINCCCGMINRYGKFTFMYVQRGDVSLVSAYPSNFYPGQIYPGQTKSTSGNFEYVHYYRNCTYKDYYIRPFDDGITLRSDSSDNGITLKQPSTVTVDWDDDSQDTYIYDDSDVEIDTGSYIIENNAIVRRLSEDKRKAIISMLLDKLQPLNYVFRDFKLECNGLPYVECGDSVIITTSQEKTIRFIVTRRTIKGIQAMKDTFEARVDESQTEYVSRTGLGGGGSSSTSPATNPDIAEMGGNVAKQLNNKEVMCVVSWDTTTGVLETTSTTIEV